MKISTCLINIVRAKPEGMALYEIEYYLGELVRLGYLDIKDFRYVIKEKENELSD